MRDRRWHLRIKTSTQVVVVGPTTPCVGTLHDLSRSGARLRLAADGVRTGTTLSLILQLSTRAFKNVRGKVVNCGPNGVSLEFEEVLDRSLFDSLAHRSLGLATCLL